MNPSEHTTPIRLGLVGLGGHGRTIQTAVERSGAFVVAAVYDPDAAEAAAAADRFGCNATSSFDALVGGYSLDAVALITPNHLHAAQTHQAFAAGLDVFVEKPIANTVAEARTMVAAARAAGRVLMVNHNMRRARAIRLARQLINDGRIGTPVSVELHFSADGTRRMAPSAWRLQPAACPLLPVTQLGIHGIDLVHYLLGPITQVYAQARTVTTTAPVVDSVAATFRTAAGLLGTFVSNYCTAIGFTFHLAGTTGSLHGTPHRLQIQQVTDTDAHGEAPREQHDFRAFDHETFVKQLAAFAEAVRTRRPPETDGWGGLQALAVVEAMQQSIATGRPIDVDPHRS